jgi:hypothetical protein
MMSDEERAEREDEIRDLSRWVDKFSRDAVLFLLQQLDTSRAEEQEAFAVLLDKRADELRLKFGPMDDAAAELSRQALAIRARFFATDAASSSILCHELLQRLRRAEMDVDRRAERLTQMMREERDEAIAVLRGLERVSVSGENFCPLCWRLQENGHEADCRLAKVLENA